MIILSFPIIIPLSRVIQYIIHEKRNILLSCNMFPFLLFNSYIILFSCHFPYKSKYTTNDCYDCSNNNQVCADTKASKSHRCTAYLGNIINGYYQSNCRWNYSKFLQVEYCQYNCYNSQDDNDDTIAGLTCSATYIIDCFLLLCPSIGLYCCVS